MNKLNFSVQTKILIWLAGILVLLATATIWHTASNEREMVAELAVDEARSMASSYFDGVNTMMLTGTTAQRGILRDKYLSQGDTTEVRIIRSPAVKQIFGDGMPDQKVMDSLDKRAMQGETVIEHSSDAKGRLVTVILPFRAEKDFRGTNCLNCHVVPEGTVLGASRVSYSLARLDKEITKNLWTSGLINIGMTLMTLAMMTVLIRKIVIRRLAYIRDTMETVASDRNLSHRIKINTKDELGRLSNAFNDMLDHFSQSLSRVSDTTHQLNQAADRITEVSRQTTEAADQQRIEADSATAAINELGATTSEVGESATSAEQASIEADQTATEGGRITRDAIDGIHALVAEIERASEVIARLDQRSQNVGGVLDVIKNIAEQTNLLALNAAIEAARAGDQGRGFAVVADEVRSLANRSHESTKEIENIIEELQQEAQEAVEVMSQAKQQAEERRQQVASADQALNRIAEQVSHIREMNTRMASAVNAQNTVTADVSRNVANINELAERTAKDAQQTSGMSDELLALASELEKLVNSFTL